MRKKIKVQNFFYDEKNFTITKKRINDFLEPENKSNLTNDEIHYLLTANFNLLGEFEVVKDNLEHIHFNEICQRITNLTKTFNSRISKKNRPKKAFILNDANYSNFVKRFNILKNSVNTLSGWNLLTNKDWARMSLLQLVIGTNHYVGLNDNESFTKDIYLLDKINKAITRYNKMILK